LKVDLIYSALPPQQDGVGDYTAIVAAEMATRADVRILTGSKPFDPIPGVEVQSAFSVGDQSSFRRIVDLVEQRRPDWVLLQYNPFGYGRRGLNLALPAAMCAIKSRAPGTRIATMVHEPFVRVENWQFAIMTTWQRLQLWRVGHCSDRVFFSIDAWTREFRRWFPRQDVCHLPVISNIPDVGLARGEAKSRLGIGTNTLVIGMFGTFHVSRMMDRLRSAALTAQAAGRAVVVLYIGRDSDLVRSVVAPMETIADGSSSPEEVSRRLSAIDIFVTAFVDGVSTRRGSFMAGLQHGLAIAGTNGPLTDPILQEANDRAFCLADSTSASQFDDCVARLAQDHQFRTELGFAARRLYRDNFSRECVTAKLFGALDVPAPEGVLA
jgi:hypothetical protein